MTIAIIVAMDENGVIGKDGDLPWHLPADLKHFRRTTTGHPIVMGRRTWDEVGRPLPGRTSIVVTRQKDLPLPDGVLRASSLEEALRLAQGAPGAETVYVVGGAQIYAAALAVADRLLVTRVHAEVAGDTRFPPFDEADWTLVIQEHHPADDRNPHDLTFRTYERATA